MRSAIRCSAPSRAGVAGVRRRPGGQRGDGRAARALERRARRAPQPDPRRSRSAAMPSGTSCGSPSGSGSIGTAVRRRPRDAATASDASASSSAGPRARTAGATCATSARRRASARAAPRASGPPGAAGRRRRGRRRWPSPSSSTIASTMASGETDRARPRRIRANDSASVRRLPSAPAISSPSRSATNPSAPISPSTMTSIGWGATSEAGDLDRGEGDEDEDEGSPGQGPQVDAFPEVVDGRHSVPHPGTEGWDQGSHPTRAGRQYSWRRGSWYFRTGSGLSEPHRSRHDRLARRRAPRAAGPPGVRPSSCRARRPIVALDAARLDPVAAGVLRVVQAERRRAR